MFSDKQIQTAGDNAQQFQSGTIIINNNGITEERARAIYSEMSQKAIADNTSESFETASERISKLEQLVIPRIEMIDKNFESFTDPAFQVLLRKAQLTAACTQREDDYKILSELLVHRINNKEDRKKKACITKAVEIVDQIDDDSLCGVTVLHSMRTFVPITGDILEGLRTLDALYQKLDLQGLPSNTLWIDNLLVLGMVTVVPFSTMGNFEEHLVNALDGYVCIGIKKNSEEHQKAIEKLNENGINESILVENELLSGYVRMAIPTKQQIEHLVYVTDMPVEGKMLKCKICITDKQKQCLFDIWNTYSKDSELMNQAKDSFYKLLDDFEAIKHARQWWNSINVNVAISPVGRVIAHTNVKGIDPTLPDLD